MKKLIIISLTLLSHLANAQFATFKFDSMDCKLNGKKIQVINQKLQVTIKDSSELITLGSSGIYSVCAKFSIGRVPTTTGNYYTPEIKFIFKKDQEVIGTSVASPSIITVEQKSTSISSIITSQKSVKLSQFYFSCKIDGSELDFKDNEGLPITNTSIDFNLNQLILEDFILIKKGRFMLQAGVEFQMLELGRYNDQPVILYYKLLHSNAGSEANAIFISSISFKSSGGKTDSTSFIQSTALSNKETKIMEKKGSRGHGKDHRIYKCRYSVYYTKQE